jgi:hypothetical protein
MSARVVTITHPQITQTVFDTHNQVDVVRTRRPLVVVHDDIIGDEFWRQNPHLLNEDVAGGSKQSASSSSATSTAAPDVSST